MSRPATGIVALVICAALVLTLSNGLRSSFGLFLTPMSLDLGVSRETFALAIAIQGIVWGISQPVFGALADRHGAIPVVLVGTVIYVAGLLWMAFAESAIGLHMGQGLLVGLGISATGFAVVLGPVGRAVPPEKRSMALGIAAAGGSFGQFALAPVGGALLDGVGWSMTLIVYCGLAAMMVPCLIGMRGSHTPPESSANRCARRWPKRATTAASGCSAAASSFAASTSISSPPICRPSSPTQASRRCWGRRRSP